MARVPQLARPGAWQKPLARIEGERILKARAMEQRVMEQKAQVEAEARRVEEMESQKLDEKVDDLREQIDRLTDNIPKIIPAGGGGKRMVAKVLARDYPDLTVFEGLAKADGNFLVGDGTNWTVESGAAVRSSLGLGTAATADAADLLARANHTGTQGIATVTDLQTTLDGKQAASANLTTLAGVTPGTTGLALLDDTSQSAARTTLGLGTSAVAALLDEDDMTTDSATGVPSQQSVKAFVNAKNVTSRTAMLALSTTAHPVAKLTEAGRAGDFVWDASDLSGTLLGAAIASSAVSSSTDTITSANHGLLPGMAVVATAAVNGLSTNTLYYVILSAIWTIHFNTQTANFTVGQTLTGGTSGATGVIVKQTDNGTTGVLWLESKTGTFVQGETITDGAGGSAKADGTSNVVFHPDKFQLASSYANARAGTVFDLTGTSAMTVKRHMDPAQGVYVTPTAAIDGSAGAWCRTDRYVRSPVATWFGFLPTNTGAGNAEAFQAAVNYNGTVHIPRGQYELTQKIYVLGRFSLSGDGIGASVLYWKDATTHGIEQYFTNDREEKIDVRNIDFKTNDTAGTSVAMKSDGTARLVGTANQGTTQMGIFQNVNIYGLTAASVAGWDGGIWCHETVNVNLNNCYFNGFFVTDESDIRSSFAYRCSSTDNGAGSVFKLANCQAYYAFRALHFDTVEGVQATQCIFVAVEYAVYGRVTGTKAGPHVSIKDSHFNFRLRGVDLDEAQQVIVESCVMYNRPTASATGMCVSLTNCIDGEIANNIFVRGGSGQDLHGVVLGSGTENIQTHDNICRDTTTGVWAQSGSTGNRSYRNDLRIVTNSAAELYLDSSSGANVFGAPYFSGTNAAIVNASASTLTTLCTVALSRVENMQRFDVYAHVTHTKGATAGLTHLIVYKSAGTATVVFNRAATEMRISPQTPIAGVPTWEFQGTMGVTAVGASNTATLTLAVNSLGSGADIAAGDAQLMLVERD